MSVCTSVLLLSILAAPASDTPDVGNRLTYLDEFCDPYYVGLQMPKLITPQWIGQKGVEAVIVPANDDLREPARHEAYMRPILERLKKIDGRAGASLMANQMPLDDPQLKAWLAEGVNLETHTWDHPCPCLQGGQLAKAKATYDQCVDALRALTGGRSVAFRMPCCDSMNSVSPRFFTEIFNKTTPSGNFQTLDSSVFQVFTANDPALPRELVFDENGGEKFRKYVPTDRVMANLIEDYPYPYVIGRLCWEIPCLMPSDWDAQHLNGKSSPVSVRDYKAAVDLTVVKRGIFSLCFHSGDWMKNSYVVEVIEHAVGKHGGKIKFLNFGEVQQRLNENLLGGHPLRAPNGQDNGVRLVDVNNDGYLDVVIGNQSARQTRIWSPETGKWTTTDFPVEIVHVDQEGNRRHAGVRFGVLKKNGNASILVRSDKVAGVWHFDGAAWTADPKGLGGLELDGPVYTASGGRDRGVRLRDLDCNGVCELVVGNEEQRAVFAWSSDGSGWKLLGFTLPEGTAIVDALGRDAGLRFADVDEDGHADVVFSNAGRYSAHVFNGITEGWSRKMLAGNRGDGKTEPGKELPEIVRADGTNNGAWFKYRHMWVQNEDTGNKLPDHVDSRYFTDDFLGAEKEPPARAPQSSLGEDRPSRTEGRTTAGRVRARR